MAERQDDQQIEFHRSGDWTAVYVGGQLVKEPGDHYHADEWLRDRIGVIVVDESPFLLPDGRTARPTVAEVDVERERRKKLLGRSAELRAEANRLFIEAENLARKGRGKTF